MASVYWSQLSGCTEIKESVSGYGCDNKGAMKALACFALFLFMQQMITAVLLIFWKDEVGLVNCADFKTFLPNRFLSSERIDPPTPNPPTYQPTNPPTHRPIDPSTH